MTNPPNPVRGVLFDAGMTLLFPRRAITETYWSTAVALGIELPRAAFADRVRSIWTRQRGLVDDDLVSSEAIEAERWQGLTAAIAAPFDDLAKQHEVWHRNLVRHFDQPAAWRLAPEAPHLLHSLRGQGIKTGVVSNWHRGLLGLLDAFELTPLFDVIVLSVTAGWRKPHPEPFRQALTQLELEAPQVVHVGDSLAEDVEGARAAGLRPVLLGHTTSDETIPAIRILPKLLATIMEPKPLPLGECDVESSLGEAKTLASSSPEESMTPNPPGSKKLSSTNVAAHLEHMVHELRNAMTVLYGGSDVLPTKPTEQHGELMVGIRDSLEEGIRRTRGITNQLLTLRSRILVDAFFRPGDVAFEVARWMPEVGPIAVSLRDMPEAEGHARDFEGLVMKIGAMSRVAGGIGQIHHEHLPGSGIQSDCLRIKIKLGDGDIPDPLLVSLDASVLALGGRLHIDPLSGELVLELAARTDYETGAEAESEA